MDLRKLQHAVLLAQTCHFARAAALAHITQSALSRSISALEDELGMRLFERGNTGVAPTAAGRTLIQRAQPLLRGARDLSHDMALFRRAELGTLAVGAGPFPAATLMPSALAALQESHPGLSLRVEINHAGALAALLQQEAIELFVADTRAEALPPGLAVEPVSVLHGGLFCRHSHPLAQRRQLQLADLATQRLASVQLPLAVEAGLIRMLRRSRDDAFAVVCDNVYLLKEVARRSDVVLVCTREALAAELASGEFVALEPQRWQPLLVSVGAVTLQGRSRSPAAQLFIATLQRVAT